jgi:hypothetical protein
MLALLPTLLVVPLLLVPPQPPASVDDLGWMAGCWAAEGGARRMEEQWMRPAGDTLLGMSRTISGGRTAFVEFLQIERVGEEVTLTALAGGPGARPVPFRRVAGAEGEAVFENPEHDFPQRILYRRAGEGGLFARIDGREKGDEKAQDFRFERVSCP